MLPSSRRTLVQALIVSVLIHAVLVLRVVDRVSLQMDAPSTVTIKAVMSVAKRGDTAKPVSADDNKPAVENSQRVSTVAKTQSPQLITTPALVSDKVVHLPAHVVEQEGVSAQPVSFIAAATMHVRDGVSADDVRQYRMSLGMAAKRFKRYPALARERGWEGTVGVELSGNEVSPVPEVVLVRSSGHSVLDDQALELTAQALRATTLPEGLRGKNFRISFPVKYSLDDL